MEKLTFKEGQLVAKKNDKVAYWYVVTSGMVIQKFELAEVKLPVNSIIGILEKDTYICDYIAGEDTELACFVCQNATDLQNILVGHERIRNIFLNAAIIQRYQLLNIYDELFKNTKNFHMFAQSLFNDYKTFCNKYRVDMRSFSRMDHFKPLEMKHKADAWEIKSSTSIVKNYMKEYLSLMEKDDSLSVGVIMEAAAQMHRFTLGIGEMEAYLSYNKDILFSDTRKDLFALFFDLTVKVHAKKYDKEPVERDLNLIIQVAEKLKVYNARMIARRVNEYQSFDYDGIFEDKDIESKLGVTVRKEIDITAQDCFTHILQYAGYTDSEMDTITETYERFRDLPDRYANSKEVHALRVEVTRLYYDIYLKAFLHAMKDERSMTPILLMFLNFGFMDVSMVGEEHAKELYELSAHLDICQSENVYTIYRWLSAIYRGEKETSKNEFDLDYKGYLAEQVKTGKIKSEQLYGLENDREKKVEFELQNMFASVNKLTYGRITTFCPILAEDDLLHNVEKMLVTADKLEQAMNKVRKTDFSVFYREVMFSDVDKGINCERIMKEVLPDIILMPNAGNRVIMWQETSSVKSDTPARFMFPIFTTVEIDTMMLEVMGAYRWEMCRKVQGVRWNDIRDKSLTSEYCDYLQFYRKNSELSPDTKQKIKSALTRAKNSYKEVFVRDYVNWIMFESKGSFRLNKITREIMGRYCPFCKEIRNELRPNPLYENSIVKFENDAKKKLQRFQAIYNKYVKADGYYTEDLKENLMYYQM